LGTIFAFGGLIAVPIFYCIDVWRELDGNDCMNVVSLDNRERQRSGVFSLTRFRASDRPKLQRTKLAGSRSDRQWQFCLDRDCGAEAAIILPLRLKRVTGSVDDIGDFAAMGRLLLDVDLDSPELAAAIADGRFFIRKAFRIFDEEAKALGLQPLENQLMVQLRGAPDLARSIGELAERLDVPSTLVSRVVTQLEKRALVKRKTSTADKRTVLVEATRKGYVLTRRVAERAVPRLDEFVGKFDKRLRRAALAVWAHNFGVNRGD